MAAKVSTLFDTAGSTLGPDVSDTKRRDRKHLKLVVDFRAKENASIKVRGGRLVLLCCSPLREF